MSESLLGLALPLGQHFASFCSVNIFSIECFSNFSANGCVGKGRRLGFKTKSSIRVKIISSRDSSQGNILEHKFSLADLL